LKNQIIMDSAPDGVSRTLTFETGLSGISQLI
jgi:hypothetical protein